MKTLETDVVIIGGGATGAGVLRDCALRGMAAILLEKDDIATGATGRNHGLLHSGARYAVTDSHSARECIQENRILKNIARHYVEDTGGLFITLPEDELSFQVPFIEACHRAGIEAEPITAEQALRLEPGANPKLLGAVRVPDGTIDPFRLTAANILDAKEHGGQLLNYTRVLGLVIENGVVCGVHAHHVKTGTPLTIRARQVINAAGIWGQQIAEYADLGLHMIPSKGSLLIMEHRINSLVLNRCRPPADADILVPGDTISLIGTTSREIPYDRIDNLRIDPDEVDTLIREGEKLAPVLSRSRILRAYAGVRPLVAAGGDSQGRTISRGIVLRDHAEVDGLPGLVTITGGKLMTYRLMAEQATDAVARHLDNTVPCCTAQRPLPGACAEQTDTRIPGLSVPVAASARYRHGERAELFLDGGAEKTAIVCECEMVTRAEIEYAAEKLNAPNLVDLRRRTRLGMGPCQGEVCACRAAGILQELRPEGQDILGSIGEFLESRWRGNQPVLWGDALREAEFSHWIYESLLGYSALVPPYTDSAQAKESPYHEI